MRLLVNSFKCQLGYDIFNEYRNRIIEEIGVDVEEPPASLNSFSAKNQRSNSRRMSKEMLDKNRFGRLSTWQNSLIRCLKINNYND